MAGPPPSSGRDSPRVRVWDPDQDPDLGIESIDVGTLRHRHALLLLAGAAAREDGWAQGAAIALARGLSEPGARVVLADLDFGEPALHARLEVPNGEGVSDVFFFGASLEHVALTADDRAFAFIPAGVGVTDPRVVLEHSGWARILDGLAAEREAAGDLLLAFVPADAPGLSALAASVGAAIALGADHECAAIEKALPEGVRLLGAYAPASGFDDAEHGSMTPAVSSEDAAPGSTAAAFSSDAALSGPTAPLGSTPASAAGRRPFVPSFALVGVMLLSVLLGVGYFAVRRAIRETGSIETPAVVAQTPQPDPLEADASGAAAGEPLPYAVAVALHQEMAEATRHVESLEREAPAAVGFFITPLVVDDAVAYRVLAGPVRDSTTAAELMDWLVENGHTGRSEWGIRANPYAFVLGEYDTRERAEQRRDELARREIPSYVLEMPYADGVTSRYLLYAGAYSGAAEAELMRLLLLAEGLSDSLVAREGRLPQ